MSEDFEEAVGKLVVQVEQPDDESLRISLEDGWVLEAEITHAGVFPWLVVTLVRSGALREKQA